MKTAISIPDKVFKSAETIAYKLGLSRSELYTKAIEEYIKDLNNQLITDKLNEIYSNNQNNDDDFKKIIKIQLKSLRLGKEKW